MKLSVIVPVYNEEKNLEKTINDFFFYLNKQSFDFEVIVVNDGSTDDTLLVVNELKNKYPIIFINNLVNRGKGAVVRQGLLLGTGDYRMFLDADNATTIDHLNLIWEKFENGADIVIGTRNSRDVVGAKQILAQAPWKRFLGVCGNLFIQTLMVRGIWDTQCGFKVFRADVVEKIVSKTKINKWAIDIEILALANKNKFRIEKIPVLWKNSDFSRVGIKDYFETLEEALKIKINILLKKYN